MAKKKKHNKRKRYNPPLTFVDKFIYILFLVVFIAISFSLIIIPLYIQKRLTFSDPSAVAFMTTGGLWWTFPLSFYLLITTIVLFACGFDQKIPLFGNPNLRYGEPPFKKSIYPIFRRKQYIQNNKGKGKVWYKSFIGAWFVVFLVFLCIYPLGICGRRVLYDDSTIKTYNSFNSVKTTYSSKDYYHLTLDAFFSQARYGAGRWVTTAEIKTKENKKIYFRNNLSERAMDEFIEIKESLDPDQITIKRAHNLENVIEDNNLSDSESKKLYELFSTP